MADFMTWGDVWKLLVLIPGGVFLTGALFWLMGKWMIHDWRKQVDSESK